MTDFHKQEAERLRRQKERVGKKESQYRNDRDRVVGKVHRIRRRGQV